MNLGQSMFALGALSLMGYMALNTNKAIMAENERLNQSQFGLTAISLAQSLSEEAMTKYFDAASESAVTGEISNVSNLTPAGSLGHGGSEHYRNASSDFNDFDDYDDLFIVYKSTNPADTISTPGSDWETAVPNLDSKYFIRAKVQYINIDNLSDTNPLNDTSSTQTWHKRLTVTVINPTTKDTLVYPTIMSYWN